MIYKKFHQLYHYDRLYVYLLMKDILILISIKNILNRYNLLEKIHNNFDFDRFYFLFDQYIMLLNEENDLLLIEIFYMLYYNHVNQLFQLNHVIKNVLISIDLL
jgi:hypothetical protein